LKISKLVLINAPILSIRCCITSIPYNWFGDNEENVYTCWSFICACLHVYWNFQKQLLIVLLLDSGLWLNIIMNIIPSGVIDHDAIGIVLAHVSNKRDSVGNSCVRPTLKSWLLSVEFYMIFENIFCLPN
jgi:hypothetical protein